MKTNLEFKLITVCCNWRYPKDITILNQIGCNFCGLEYAESKDYEHLCECGETTYLKIIDSGSSYSHYWCSTDYWLVAEGKCDHCGIDLYISDSSLW